MDEQFETEETEEMQPVGSKKRKFVLELKDMLASVAFPFIIMLIFSSSIISFASVDDLTVSLLALIGGEAMLVGALIIFGRANGANAYKNTIDHAQKRALNSKEEKVFYYTGEYALWKGVVIAAITCLPFIVFQIIELCVANKVTGFCLRYICAWAFYPFSYLGEKFQALNFIMLILPIGVHTLGYHLGKLKEMKERQLAAEAANRKGRKKK